MIKFGELNEKVNKSAVNQVKYRVKGWDASPHPASPKPPEVLREVGAMGARG
jgi:hypothetical protein